MFSGGHPGTSMPRCRPISARTALISFSDLRPKFGVRSISASVFWIRSPMYTMLSFFRQLAERTDSSSSSTFFSSTGLKARSGLASSVRARAALRS